MKYLFSVAPEKVAEQDGNRWGPPGEPVVPWYPATLVSVFLCVGSFKQAQYAEVKDLDVDIDKLASQLKTMYPGLPSQLHDNFVLATAKAAHELPLGTKVQLILDYNKAVLKVVNKDVFYTLWEELPMQ